MKEPSIYSDYLQLDPILHSQTLLSERAGKREHEEMLFIIMHQTYELWLKQILHDLDSILEIFHDPKKGDMEILLIRLQRILKIFELLMKQFEIIETMTPLKFLNFRSLLGTMSGFQSYQFRLIEIKLGLKRDERLLYNHCPFDVKLKEEQKQLIHQAETQSSLFYYLEKWLERIPFLKTPTYHFIDSYRISFDQLMKNEKLRLMQNLYGEEGKDSSSVESELEEINKTFSIIFDEKKYDELLKKGERHLSYQSFLAALFLRLYCHEPLLHLPDQLLSTVYEVNSIFTLWRYRHSLMVQKMIGWKRGTGGSSGVDYLRSTVEKHNIFSDLYLIPMLLLPESHVPPLPKDLIPSLNFFFNE